MVFNKEDDILFVNIENYGKLKESVVVTMFSLLCDMSKNMKNHEKYIIFSHLDMKGVT